MEQNPNTPVSNEPENDLAKKLEDFAATQNPFPDQKAANRAAYSSNTPHFDNSLSDKQKAAKEWAEQEVKKAAEEAAAQEAAKAEETAEAEENEEEESSILNEDEESARRRRSDHGDGYTVDPKTQKTRLIIVAVVMAIILFYCFVICKGEVPEWLKGMTTGNTGSIDNIVEEAAAFFLA